MDDLRQNIVRIRPRENSGALSSNRFDFQKNWALCKILELHERPDDYLVILEFHDDIIIFDSSTNPDKISFYQVKTNKKPNWTIRELITPKKGKDGKFMNSYLGKLYAHIENFEDSVASLNFVNNNKIKSKLKIGTRYSQETSAVETTNRLKYNGKEEQTTGNLGFLDYGARMYNTELGRWFTVDPMAEAYYSSSSYNYCANNCIKNVDPDGALYSPYYDSRGNFLGVDKGGFSGQIYITTLKSYLNVILNDQWDSKMKRMQDVNLSAKAYSKIYSHVLSTSGYDLSRLENGAVLIKAEDYNYNNPSAKVRFASTTWYKSRTKFKINVAQEGNGVKDELAFVENIVNALGVH